MSSPPADKPASPDSGREERVAAQPVAYPQYSSIPIANGSKCESRDPLDAAHSPPSVLQQHLGPPTIEHKYPHDSRTKRHSFSHQERYYMR